MALGIWNSQLWFVDLEVEDVIVIHEELEVGASL